MSFRETPARYLRTARCSRDVCRDAAAVERPMPAGHRWVVPVGLFVGMFLVILFAWEKFT